MHYIIVELHSSTNTDTDTKYLVENEDTLDTSVDSECAVIVETFDKEELSEEHESIDHPVARLQPKPLMNRNRPGQKPGTYG